VTDSLSGIPIPSWQQLIIFLPTLDFIMAVHPQVDLYTQKVEAFMAKYPKVTGKGTNTATQSTSINSTVKNDARAVSIFHDNALTVYDTRSIDFFQSLQEKTGYPAAWFFLATCGVIIAALTLLGGAKLLVDVVGFVYPAYMSFKSIDGSSSSSSTTDSTIKRAEETQWLTYWVCFAFMSLLETVFGFLTRLIPLYYWLKLAIVVVRTFIQQGRRRRRASMESNQCWQMLTSHCLFVAMV
jgi:TB2/DP1, HVA22 family